MAFDRSVSKFACVVSWFWCVSKPPRLQKKI